MGIWSAVRTTATLIVIDRETTEVYTLSPKSIINIPYLLVIGLVLLIFGIFIALVIKRSKRNQPK